MASGIAEVAALAGFEVTVRSRTRTGAKTVLANLDKSLAKQVDRTALPAEESDAAGRSGASADHCPGHGGRRPPVRRGLRQAPAHSLRGSYRLALACIARPASRRWRARKKPSERDVATTVDV